MGSAILQMERRVPLATRIAIQQEPVLVVLHALRQLHPVAVMKSAFPPWKVVRESVWEARNHVTRLLKTPASKQNNASGS